MELWDVTITLSPVLQLSLCFRSVDEDVLRSKEAKFEGHHHLLQIAGIARPPSLHGHRHVDSAAAQPAASGSSPRFLGSGSRPRPSLRRCPRSFCWVGPFRKKRKESKRDISCSVPKKAGGNFRELCCKQKDLVALQIARFFSRSLFSRSKPPKRVNSLSRSPRFVSETCHDHRQIRKGRLDWETACGHGREEQSSLPCFECFLVAMNVVETWHNRRVTKIRNPQTLLVEAVAVVT